MKLFSCVLLLLLSACGPDLAPDAAADPGGALSPAAAGALAEWSSTPSDGIDLRYVNSSVAITTGRHTVIWPVDATVLEPPYTVTATMHKRQGRIYEGYGLVFGGDPLDAPENEQAYSYFLVRGDGSFLVRRRERGNVPVLFGWTTHPAILRDTEAEGRPNELRVEVGTEDVVFRVNGQEVQKVPAVDLRTRGLPGIRVSHDVNLEVQGFTIHQGFEGGGDRG